MKLIDFLRGGPLRVGFFTTIGVLLALALGSAVASLSATLTLIFLALFITLGLYPLVRWLERRGLKRTPAVLIVIGGILVLLGLVIWAVLPPVIDQAVLLIRSLPGSFDELESQQWFIDLNETFGGALVTAAAWLEGAIADPTVWATVGGGALQIGAGVVNGVFGTVFVIVLTLYFVVSLEGMKQALYALVPASKRLGFSEIAEEIFESVGKYLSGMVILAFMYASFSFILLSIAGIRYAAILAVLVFPITLIPLVGSVISTTIITIVTLLTDPSSVIVVLIALVIYMQVEAYVLTPRIVSSKISIPGSLVLIGALVGGTLLGLLGALVACPVTAALLLINKKVILPRQQLL